MKYFFYPERRFVTFAPIMSNNPKSPIIDLQQQQLLLRMEYEHEKEEFKRQTETMGVARKVKRGLCWYPVSLGRSYYNSLNQLVIDITRTENKEMEHSFEFGRPVCFFHQSFEGKVKYMNFIATVSFADEERMVVVLPGAGALAELQTDGILGCNFILTKHPTGPCSRHWKTPYELKIIVWQNCVIFCLAHKNRDSGSCILSASPG